MDCKQANATAFRQWRSWLRGADFVLAQREMEKQRSPLV
jgi:hypothetical protein